MSLRPLARLVMALWVGGAVGCSSAPLGPEYSGGVDEFIPATDGRIQLTDGLRRIIGDDGSVRFDRGIDTPGRGFRWDSPGTRMRWRTDSPETRAILRYSTGHLGSSRNSVGVFRVDGRSEPGWTFTRPAPGESRVVVPLPVPAGGALHDYEIILPYGDSVDLLGIEVRRGAILQVPTPRPAVRYLAFGDSITHGFTATDVTRTYAFAVAERNGWELLNLGIGSRGTRGADGARLASIEAEFVSVLIGVNDWQAGAELEGFRRNYRELLAGLRTTRPDRPVYLITPLWVPPSWQPTAARYPLERYREVIREEVAATGDPRLQVVEGPMLIDHDDALFDPIAVHPNDSGFAQMAERLARAMQ